MIKVVPIIRPQVAWGDLLKLTQAGLGRSISRSIDSARWPLTDPRSIVAVLSQLQCDSSGAADSLRDPGSVLRHLSYSFLVLASKDTFFEVASDGVLSILLSDNDRVAVMSATLEDWRNTIVMFCKESATPSQREFAFASLEAFDSIGLSGIFDDYSRRPKTMTLVKK